jgi:hypothetical protein
LTLDPLICGVQVTNVAVTVDGKEPVRCACTMIEDCVLKMYCNDESFVTASHADFQDLSCCTGSQECLLLRAVFVALGVVEPNQQGYDARFTVCRIPRNSTYRWLALPRVSLGVALRQRLGGGVCVVCVSDLPAGSGMGGSSILAAAVLCCLGDLLGLNSSQEGLVYQVSQVEQILTAGGGWQDQVSVVGIMCFHSLVRRSMVTLIRILRSVQST